MCPSYETNLVSPAILQKKGAYHRPEAKEIVYNGQHVCSVMLRGKHYILEETTNPESLNRWEDNVIPSKGVDKPYMPGQRVSTPYRHHRRLSREQSLQSRHTLKRSWTNSNSLVLAYSRQNPPRSLTQSSTEYTPSNTSPNDSEASPELTASTSSFNTPSHDPRSWSRAHTGPESHDSGSSWHSRTGTKRLTTEHPGYPGNGCNHNTA
jgi:hypothetical protein